MKSDSRRASADRRFVMVVLVAFAAVALFLAGSASMASSPTPWHSEPAKSGSGSPSGLLRAKVQWLVQGGAMAVIGLGVSSGASGPSSAPG